MKNLMLLLVAITISTGVFSQTSSTTTTTTTSTSQKKMADCCKMKDGKMWCVKDGKTTAMTQDKTLPNGTVVMANGTVKMKDGTTTTLTDGQSVDMNGNVKTKSPKTM